MRHSADRPYKPRRGSFAERVIEFFRVNVEEELTSTDIAAKFGFPQGGVASSLEPAVASGLLARTGRRGVTVTFRAGPRLTAGEYPEREQPQPAQAKLAPAGAQAAAKPDRCWPFGPRPPRPSRITTRATATAWACAKALAVTTARARRTQHPS